MTPDTQAPAPEPAPTADMVLVPREPTERMLNAADGWTDLIDAAGENTRADRHAEFRTAWRAMLAASPTPSPVLVGRLVSVNEYARDYYFEGDWGGHTPNECEQAMIEDAIEGYLTQVEEAARASSCTVQSCVTTPLAGEAGAVEALREELAHSEMLRKAAVTACERLRATTSPQGPIWGRWFKHDEAPSGSYSCLCKKGDGAVSLAWMPAQGRPHLPDTIVMPFDMPEPGVSLTPPKAETDRDKTMIRGLLWELREYAAMDARDGPAGAVVNVLGQAAYDWLGDRIEAFVADQFSGLPAPKVETEPTPSAVPGDVRALVIAARAIAFGDSPRPSPDALRALDTASEAFASRVPWEDEP